MNLNISETEAMINALNDLALYLNYNAPMTNFNVFGNGTTSATYKLNNHYVTVKRDANCKAYSVTFHLKRFSTLDGKINKNVIASSIGDVPF